MKNTLPIPLFFLLLIFLGCKSTPQVLAPNATPAPRYGNRIQVAQYDTTSRPINPNFEVFAREEDVPRPFKIIALVSHSANPQDEGLMMTAIAWKAKQIGADGMIILNPHSGGWKSEQIGNFGGGKSEEPIFRAHAIIWATPSK